MLKSVFDLPQSKEDLSSANNGMANYYYDQVQPLRTVSDAVGAPGFKKNFPNGTITFRWDYPSGTWWLPSKTFIRMRVKVTKANGTALDLNDDIGIQMGAVGSLFSEMSFTMNDKIVSTVDRHIGEIDALINRMDRTGSWLNSTGHELNMWKSSVYDRINEVSVDGVQFDRLPSVVSHGKDLDLLAMDFTALANSVAADTLRFTFVGPNAGESSIEYKDVAVATSVVFIGVDGVLDPALTAAGVVVGAQVAFTANDRTYWSTVLRIQTAILGVAVDNNIDNKIIISQPMNIEAAVVEATLANELIRLRVIRRPIASRRVSEIELIWKPSPLAIFRVPHAIPGGGLKWS